MAERVTAARPAQKAPPVAAPKKLTAKTRRAPEKLTERLTVERGYTTKDFTALRAYVQRIPPAVIARTYYDPDEDPHAATPGAMERHLNTMLDALVALALAHGSTALADHLRASIRQHGRPLLTAVTFRMVADAAQLAAAPPHADHPIGAWLRPRVARRLKGEGLATLGELVAFCNRRGASWWRSIPRIGPGRARAVVSWLRKQQMSLQLAIEADVDSEEQDGVPRIAAELVEVAPAVKVTGSGLGGGRDGSEESPSRLTLAPLERLAVPRALSGAHGENRSAAFCYIQANHDLEAVRAYLNRFRDQPKTLRAYTKELERFLLWAVVLRGRALSDLRVDDCEAYKDFLKSPDPRFVGERFPRHSPRWRPFALTKSSVAGDGKTSLSATLSPDSQRYSVRVLRTAFTWWVDVRYLAGNPWKAVNDPAVIKRERAMKIERALPANLWRKLRDELDQRSTEEGVEQGRQSASGVQWRAVRAAMLLMGDSGLRREEAASARREHLRPSSFGTLERPVWELTIVGKGQRERTVPVSAATLNALRAHWLDRTQDFDGATEEHKQSGPLLSPVVIPWTDASRRRHRAGQGGERQPATEAGYTADGLNRLISRMVTELVETMDNLSLDERMRLGRANAHAFRHTFGTQSVAEEVPVDVVQKVLGHASLQTTTIYVQAEKQRVVEEVARYYAGVATHKTGQ
ncbi:phage integrase family protein [Caballeronia sp. S22]|uniref:phage integrase family protein n=1 Tax=Caballeronia sp. S22 TaxID=3137182 RepID=UPI00353069A4